MNIKKLLLVSMSFALVAGVTFADGITLVDSTGSTSNIASTSYVKGGLATRVSAAGVASVVGANDVTTDTTTGAKGNIVTSVTIVNDDDISGKPGSGAYNKKIQITKSEVQIPVKSGGSTQSYTSIWTE